MPLSVHFWASEHAAYSVDYSRFQARRTAAGSRRIWGKPKATLKHLFRASYGKRIPRAKSTDLTQSVVGCFCEAQNNTTEEVHIALLDLRLLIHFSNLAPSFFTTSRTRPVSNGNRHYFTMFQVFQMTKGESSDEYVLGEPTLTDESRAVKKRNRVLQSCIPCHELRRKCDRKRPCTRCVDHGVGGQCVYQLEDPAARSGTNTDELTRLRSRVAELEKTVRVLMQRPLRGGSNEGLPEGIDAKVLATLESLSATSSDIESSRRRKGRHSPSDDPEESSPSGYPGYSTGSSSLLQIPLVPGLRLTASGSPESTSPLSSYRDSSSPPDPSSIIDFSLLGSSDAYGRQPLPHCGCASTPDGRKLYAQLQTSMGDALHKLRGLASHQHQGTSCHLFTSLTDLLSSVRSAAQAKSFSPPQPTFATPSPVSAFGPHTAFPLSHSHSSHSPPLQDPSMSLSYQTITGFNQTAIPQQSSYQFSYPSRHPDLSHTSQHLSTSPPLGMAAMSNSAYQSHSLGHLHPPSSGISGHQPPAIPASGFTSTLSAWDDMAGPSSPQLKVRPSSSTRGGSKQRSPYEPRFGKS